MFLSIQVILRLDLTKNTFQRVRCHLYQTKTKHLKVGLTLGLYSLCISCHPRFFSEGKFFSVFLEIMLYLILNCNLQISKQTHEILEILRISRSHIKPWSENNTFWEYNIAECSFCFISSANT